VLVAVVGFVVTFSYNFLSITVYHKSVVNLPYVVTLS